MSRWVVGLIWRRRDKIFIWSECRAQTEPNGKCIQSTAVMSSWRFKTKMLFEKWQNRIHRLAFNWWASFKDADDASETSQLWFFCVLFFESRLARYVIQGPDSRWHFSNRQEMTQRLGFKCGKHDGSETTIAFRNANALAQPILRQSILINFVDSPLMVTVSPDDKNGGANRSVCHWFNLPCCWHFADIFDQLVSD